jgi:hypothetical protein
MPATQLQKEYGGIYVVDNAVTTSISVQNQWYQVTVFDTDMSENIADSDHTNDHIQVGTTGLFRLSWNASFSGGGNHEYELQLQKNDGASILGGTKVSRLMGSGGDVGACGAQALVALSANDTVELWIRDTNVAPADATVQEASITVERIA